MEINSISSAFASAAGVEETDEQKETKKAQEEKSKEESVKAKKREEKDTVDLAVCRKSHRRIKSCITRVFENF